MEKKFQLLKQVIKNKKMNYLKNYLIAFSILMGCNAPVCGVDLSYDSDNSSYDSGNFQLEPITFKDIKGCMNTNECMKMVMMLIDNNVMSASYKSRFIKSLGDAENEIRQPELLDLLFQENEISFCEPKNNDLLIDQNDLLRVLYVKKDDTVVAACLTGCSLVQDNVWEMDDDIRKKKQQKKRDENQWIGHNIQLIRDAHPNIPIQVCRPWDSWWDEFLMMLEPRGEDRNLYFLNGDKNKPVLKQGGTVLFKNLNKDLSTNAKYIFMNKPSANCMLTCSGQKHFTTIKGDNDGYNNIKKGGCLSLRGPLLLDNHVRSVHMEHDGLRVKVEVGMGVFDMQGKSMALMQGAHTSRTFHVGRGGIALVINSTLEDISVTHDSCVVLVNSSFTSKKEERVSEIIDLHVDRCSNSADYAKKVLDGVIKELDHSYSTKHKYSVIQNTDLKPKEEIIDLVKSVLDSFKDDIQWNGDPDSERSRSEKVLGKRQREEEEVKEPQDK